MHYVSEIKVKRLIRNIPMLDQRAVSCQDKISMHKLPCLPAQPFHATTSIEKRKNCQYKWNI